MAGGDPILPKRDAIVPRRCTSLVHLVHRFLIHAVDRKHLYPGHERRYQSAELMGRLLAQATQTLFCSAFLDEVTA